MATNGSAVLPNVDETSVNTDLKIGTFDRKGTFISSTDAKKDSRKLSVASRLHDYGNKGYLTPDEQLVREFDVNVNKN